jgi:parvulin-like peptidyl-prolyl isomerase
MNKLEGKIFKSTPAVFTLGLLVVFILFPGCPDFGKSDYKVAGNEVVATVNQAEILVKEVKGGISARKKQFRVGEEDTLKEEELLWLKTESLNESIRNALLMEEVKKHNINLTQEEFEEALMVAKSGYQEDSFDKTLEIEKISDREWDNRLKNNLLIKKLINEVVNSKVFVEEDELLEYFQGNEDEFQKGEEIRALHIMVETEEEARKILKQIKSKKRGFADLAREHSIGQEGPEGGDLGFIEQGQMPPELDSVFKLNVNETSDIIRTPYGSHIFQVVEKLKARKMGFKESKDMIHDKLLRERQDKAFQEWLTGVKERAKIEIRYDVLEKII